MATAPEEQMMIRGVSKVIVPVADPVAAKTLVESGQHITEELKTQARQAASEVKEAAGQAARETGQQTREQAQQVAGQARESGQRVGTSAEHHQP